MHHPEVALLPRQGLDNNMHGTVDETWGSASLKSGGFPLEVGDLRFCKN